MQFFIHITFFLKISNFKPQKRIFLFERFSCSVKKLSANGETDFFRPYVPIFVYSNS